MKFKDKIVMCFSNLYKRKMRTFMTIMGVVVGTCAIVITVSLGVGMQKSQEEALAQMGDLTIINIFNWNSSVDNPLNDEVLEQIRAMDHVVALTPAYNPEWGSIQLVSGKYQYDGTIFGVYMDDLNALGYKLADGSELPEMSEYSILYSADSPYDFYNTKKSRNNRVYPGSGKDPYVDVAEDKIAIQVRLPDDSKKKPKQYDAVFAGIMMDDWSKSPSSSYGIFMDIATVKKLELEYKRANNIKVEGQDKTNYDQVTVKVDDMDNVAEVEEKIQALGFETNSMETVRKPLQEKAQKDQMMLGSLGAISLIVAAIGISNTMIMSVYERTREIGVMKVLGCLISDIRNVFLMEAGCIGFMGGVVGVIVSYIVSYAINYFGTPGSAESMDLFLGAGGMGSTSIIPWWLSVGALVFATLIGLLSGIYPANRAVKIPALTAIKQD